MTTHAVSIPAEKTHLPGVLTIPEGALGLVLFAHGSGSSRLSPRNQFVADELHKANIATLLFDLLTEEEDAVYERRFDIDHLTTRLLAATEFAEAFEPSRHMRIGYFGASTGAAAALNATGILGDSIHAVVSRGGRPDLARDKYLAKVQAPTLLIVGGEDTDVIRMNELAFAKIKAEKKLEIVPGATHLFEEAGKLEEVARLAAEWFTTYLPL